MSDYPLTEGSSLHCKKPFNNIKPIAAPPPGRSVKPSNKIEELKELKQKLSEAEIGDPWAYQKTVAEILNELIDAEIKRILK